jgi:hypothetical protein
MIYALVREQVSEADRQILVAAVKQSIASVLAQYASQGDIRHVMDASDSEEYYCMWCYLPVKPRRSNNPGLAAEPWHFDHVRNPGGACQGQNSPPNQGCYIQLGHEDEPQFGRAQCKCISEGRTYCHHAASPVVGETPCMNVP